MRFAFLETKSLLQDWIGLKMNFSFACEDLGEVDTFSHLDSRISSAVRISDEMFEYAGSSTDISQC